HVPVRDQLRRDEGLRAQGPQQLRALRGDLREPAADGRRAARSISATQWASPAREAAGGAASLRAPSDGKVDQPCVGAARRVVAVGGGADVVPLLHQDLAQSAERGGVVVDGEDLLLCHFWEPAGPMM